MDDRRFDAWTRKMSGTTSRRPAVNALVGGFLGAALTPADAGAATCRAVGERCGISKPLCCSENNSICDGSRCICPFGLKNCSGTCRNLQTSRQACGSCTNKCARGKVCKAGKCSRP